MYKLTFGRSQHITGYRGVSDMSLGYGALDVTKFIKRDPSHIGNDDVFKSRSDI